jgi:hypothetical protein
MHDDAARRSAVLQFTLGVQEHEQAVVVQVLEISIAVVMGTPMLAEHLEYKRPLALAH